MIDIKFLRENPDLVKENIKKKFQDAKLPLVDEVITLDEELRANKKKADELRANRNKISKTIGALMGQKKFAEAQGLEFPLIADVETTLLQQLGCWGEKVACGRRTIGTLRTTYLVNEDGVIEKIFTPKEIKTKIHAEQILDYINGNN